MELIRVPERKSSNRDTDDPPGRKNRDRDTEKATLQSYNRLDGDRGFWVDSLSQYPYQRNVP